jgi:hypothetical protein
MRECPAWFQDALTAIGGLNPYDEPVFRMVWSTDERMVIGGKWEKDGFEGYKYAPGVPGEPCWALMMWEPREMYGSPERWAFDYADDETGLLQCGGYPKYGRYRMLKRFIHRELEQQAAFVQAYDNGKPYLEMVEGVKMKTYRLEPCSFILDLMLPSLRIWLKLSDEAKRQGLLQEEQLEKDKMAATLKDARAGVRVRRSSQLVQKRAEVIEKGMEQAMRIASKMGLGIQVSA